MRPNSHLSPDDIQDLKAFSEAVCRGTPPERIAQLLERYINTCFRTVNLAERHKNFYHQENLALACLIELYCFLRENEATVKELIVIRDEGDPFIYEPND